MFISERFFTVVSKPVEYLEETRFMDDLRGTKPPTTYKPWAYRWLDGKQPVNKSIVKVIDKDQAFNFYPCS